MRMMLATAAKRDPRHALSALASSGALPPAPDLQVLESKLLSFDVALWRHFFFQHFGHKLGAEEVARRFAIALGLALRDAGVPERLDSTINASIAYLEHAATVEESDVARNDPFFYHCQHFTRRVLSGADLTDRSTLDCHFQVFDIAKQNYSAVQAAFSSLTKEYKLVTD